MQSYMQSGGQGIVPQQIDISKLVELFPGMESFIDISERVGKLQSRFDKWHDENGDLKADAAKNDAVIGTRTLSSGSAVENDKLTGTITTLLDVISRPSSNVNFGLAKFSELSSWNTPETVTNLVVSPAWVDNYAKKTLGEKISGIISVLGDSDNSGLRKKVADLAAQIQSVNQSLSQSISSIDNKIDSYISKAKKDMLDTIFPVGSMYTQYPGALSPKEIFEKAGYTGSVWKNTTMSLNSIGGGEVDYKNIWVRSARNFGIRIVHPYNGLHIDGKKIEEYAVERLRNKIDVFAIRYSTLVNHFDVQFDHVDDGKYTFDELAQIVRDKLISLKSAIYKTSIISVIRLAAELFIMRIFNPDLGMQYNYNKYNGVGIGIDSTVGDCHFFTKNNRSIINSVYHNKIDVIRPTTGSIGCINIALHTKYDGTADDNTEVFQVPNFINLIQDNKHNIYKRIIIYFPVAESYVVNSKSLMSAISGIAYGPGVRNNPGIHNYVYRTWIFDRDSYINALVICDR